MLAKKNSATEYHEDRMKLAKRHIFTLEVKEGLRGYIEYPRSLDNLKV